jgi:uncharacterized delta-60 repeat protein
MRKPVAALGVALALGLAALAVAAPSDRDPAFDADGVVAHDLGAYTRFQDVAALSSGDSVAVGSTRALSAGPPPSSVIAARYDSAGALRSPIRHISVGEPAEAIGSQRQMQVAVDSQNRVLVAVGTDAGNLVVARLTGDDLALDTSFSGDGLTVPLAVDPDDVDVIGIDVTDDDRPTVVANYVDPGPKMLIARWTAGGDKDTAFGKNGRITVGSADTGAQASDMFVEGGFTWVARSLNPGGLDVARYGSSTTGAAFNTPASVETNYMRIQPSGTGAIVAGAEPVGADITVRLAKLSGAGDVDITFGTPTATVPGLTGILRGIAVQGDGKIVGVLQTTDPGAAKRLTLVRFNADGTPDSTFAPGQNSHFATDDLGFANTSVEPEGGLAIAADDKVLVAGRTYVASADDAGAGDQAFVARYGAGVSAVPTLTAVPTASSTPTPSPTATVTPDDPAPELSKARAARRGRVKLVLSRAATIKVTIARRVGRRFRRKGTQTVTGEGGSNTIKLRLDGERLEPGVYRVRLVARAGGRRSAPVVLRVKVKN